MSENISGSYGDITNADTLGEYFSSIRGIPVFDTEQELELPKKIEAGLVARYILRVAEVKIDIEPTRDTSAENDTSGSLFSSTIQAAQSHEILNMKLRQIEQEGVSANDEMVMANLGLVVFIAKKYRGSAVPLLDLIQEGTVGLIHAVRMFDYKQGTKFSTYAYNWITKAIVRMADNGPNTVRYPEEVIAMDRLIQRAKRDFSAEFGRGPTTKELSNALGIPLVKLRKSMQINRNIRSLNARLNDESTTELGDLLPDRTVNIAEAVINSQQQRSLREFIENLSEYERTILTLRFGLDGGEPMGSNAIGKRVNKSEKSVRRTENKLLAELRIHLDTSLGKNKPITSAKGSFVVEQETTTTIQPGSKNAVTYRSLTTEQHEKIKEQLAAKSAAELGITSEELEYLKLRFSGMFAGDIAKKIGGRTSAIGLSIGKALNVVARRVLG